MVNRKILIQATVSRMQPAVEFLKPKPWVEGTLRGAVNRKEVCALRVPKGWEADEEGATNPNPTLGFRVDVFGCLWVLVLDVNLPMPWV